MNIENMLDRITHATMCIAALVLISAAGLAKQFRQKQLELSCFNAATSLARTLGRFAEYHAKVPFLLKHRDLSYSFNYGMKISADAKKNFDFDLTERLWEEVPDFMHSAIQCGNRVEILNHRIENCAGEVKVTGPSGRAVSLGLAQHFDRESCVMLLEHLAQSKQLCLIH